MNTTTWPYGTDADQHDPLTAHRIAVTSSHPMWRFLVAFDRESEARPTDAETAMLVSFLDEYKHHWYNPGFLSKLAEKPLDVDGGANGVIFHKWAGDDWGYRRQSYTIGNLWTVAWPSQRDGREYGRLAGPLSLTELMDRINGHGDDPNPRWEAWKAAHPEVFA